jgi:CRP-like cAMP-binding protein
MTSVPRSGNHLLHTLPAAEFEALRPYLRSLELVREAVLLEAGSPLTHVVLPQTGIIAMMVRLSEGQTVEVAMIGRDSIAGASAALADGPALMDAVVVVPGTASVIEIADFREAANRSSAFRNLLARHEQALFAQAQQSAACNASHPVEARLSRLLLRARDLCDGERLPLTQELLAQMIGVRRNAVSIVAHALQQAGVISYSRGHIEITDIDGLRKTSCECYRAVKLQSDWLLGTADRPARNHR